MSEVNWLHRWPGYVHPNPVLIEILWHNKVYVLHEKKENECDANWQQPNVYEVTNFLTAETIFCHESLKSFVFYKHTCNDWHVLAIQDDCCALLSHWSLSWIIYPNEKPSQSQSGLRKIRCGENKNCASSSWASVNALTFVHLHRFL